MLKVIRKGYFEKIVPAGIIESGGILRPGKIITEAPMEQLLETTAPKWFRPVSMRSPFMRYCTFFLVRRTLAVPE